MSGHPIPIFERVWKYIDFSANEDGCWIWTGSATRTGYGMIHGEYDAATGYSRRYMAYRWLYEYLVAPIPEGMQLDHLCRNRPCVNPEHLEPVTGRENNLRGNGFGGINARKTHCPRGHSYADPSTTRIYANPTKGVVAGRRCLACNTISQRAYRARRKAVA